MGRDGVMARIELYKKWGNTALLEKEEEFLKKNFGPKEEKPKTEKSKKTKD